MVLQHLNPLRRGRVPEVPTERKVSREQSAGFWSRLGFFWLNPLKKAGYKRPLERNDIWLVPDARAIHPINQKLEDSFRKRILAKSRFPLAWALYETFKFDFWLGGACQLLGAVLQVMTPFTLRYLILLQEVNSSPLIATGMGYVIGILVMQIIQSFALSHFNYRSMLIGGQSRSALIALVFGKSLKLSRRAKAGGKPEGQETGADHGIAWRADPQGWSNGRIMNLISTDASRIEQACVVFHLIWSSPIQIALTVVLLVVNLGYSALAGVAILVGGLATLTKVIKFLTESRAAINKITDQRVDLTQEILQSIRFVKYFGWEGFFLRRLKLIRAAEVRALQLMHTIKSGIGAVSMALPIFSNMTAFIVFSVTSHELEAAIVFSSFALFNSLITPMNWLPISIGYAADAYTSLKRIEGFLLAEEVALQVSHTPGLEYAVQLNQATFTWEGSPLSNASDKPELPNKHAKHHLTRFWKGHQPKVSVPKETNTVEEHIRPVAPPPLDSTAFQLKNISFQVGPGELVGIIGSVGCGKTSLLSALASDMRQVGGSMQFSTDRAYCPQYAWIQNATIRDNIIFGKPFDSRLYSQVVQACALMPDFEALPNNDLTEIGERGITLSGGQKQRINIARAIYSDAGIVLLDDPLSAVDAHVGTHLFNEAICGLLGSKCRIFATHQLQFLSRCDKVIWVVAGQIEAVGTYQELMHTNLTFAKLLATTGPQQIHTSSSNEKRENEVEITERPSGTDLKEKPEQLMKEDVKIIDSVPWSVYIAWMRSSGSLLNIIAVLLLQALFRAANILTSLWLSWWVSNRYGLSRGQNIGIYAGLGTIQAVLLFSFSMITGVVGTKSSQTMSNEAMWQILRAPLSFFDTTPLGRIIHRFTKDVDAMDNNLTDSFRQYLIVMSSLIGTFGLIIAYFHYFAVALAVCTFALWLSVSYYRSSARELKRHHAILDGAVFSRFSEALVGASCIRAYGREHQFIDILHKSIDDMDGAYFLTFANQRWLSVRLDNIGNTLTFTTGILVVTNQFSISASIAGLILSYSLSAVAIIQITVKYLAEVDNSMSSTERLHQYTTSVAQEAPLECAPVPATWPEHGAIKYEAVQMRYRPGLPLVIDNFSLQINGGERIGIVGRTGAGKSTILSTLFRLTELSGGRITVDGVDISQVGLHQLRSRLAIIPQDPTLFRGKIRSNLDPFNKHTDLQLWDALRQAHLNPVRTLAEIEKDGGSISDGTSGSSSSVTLDEVVDEEGLNFSLGQRQLIALARALLRDSRIVLVDEGTSSVDPKTDARIQDTLARGLKGKTLIAIAHRLRTVLQYNRVCVMDMGKIAELGRPLELWERDGIFRGMCDSSGITRGDFV